MAKTIALVAAHLMCSKLIEVSIPSPLATAFLDIYHLIANVDWAMLNFMQDWFPQESRLKLRQNEEESTKEQMEELGFNDQPCRVM